MSPDHLRTCSRKQLELIARRQGVANIRQLRKQDLIDVLAQSPELSPAQSPRIQAPRVQAPRVQAPRAAAPFHARSNPPTAKRTPRSHQTSSSAPQPAASPVAATGDELALILMDPQWLRATWQISQSTRDRAIAALGMHWHRASLVLQLIDVTPDESPVPVGKASEFVLPSGTGVWYLHLPASQGSFRVALGYRSPAGKFHLLLRSRPVTPARMRPQMTQSDSTLCEPAGQSTATHPSNARRTGSPQDFSTQERIAAHRTLVAEFDGPPPLTVDAELIVRGQTHPTAIVTLAGRPLSVAADGGFVERIPLEPGRQVIPVVAGAPDGSGERTVVLALDLSNRELEPRTPDNL